MTRPSLAGVHHVKLPVTDLPRSVSWYERVFGFRTMFEFQDDDGVVRGVAGELPGFGDTLVAFRENPAAARGCQDFDPVGFAVRDRADIEAWAEYLDTLGIAHSPVIDASIGWLLVCHDPDRIELHLYSWESHGMDQTGRTGYGRRVGQAEAGA